MNNNLCFSNDQICLCSRCASVFYDSKDHYIERVAPYQILLEPCDICKNPHGYEFIVRSRINVRNRMFEGGPENE